MEESGNPEWDGRQNHSPLAEVQYPPKQHGQHARPSTSPSPDMMDSTSPLSPLARTAQFEEDNRTRAERMADHREQNALLQARNMHVRDFFLENMRSERDRRNRQVSRDRSEKREMWNQRLRNSPFTVDLLAENERIDEELRVRQKFEAKRLKVLAKKKNRVKSDIILKALAETDDLAALRAEKRALIDEEKRLKAMRDLEKVGAKTINAEKRIADLRKERQQEQQNKRMLRRQRLQLEQPHLQAVPIFQRASTAPAIVTRGRGDTDF